MTGALAACSGSATTLVTLTGTSLIVSGAGTQVATYKICSDGTVKDQDGTVLETWKHGGNGADYEVRTDTGDSPTGSATGTWLDLSVDRSWTVTDTTVGGFVNAALQISIGRVGMSSSLIPLTFVTIRANRTS